MDQWTNLGFSGVPRSGRSSPRVTESWTAKESSATACLYARDQTVKAWQHLHQERDILLSGVASTLHPYKLCPQHDYIPHQPHLAIPVTLIQFAPFTMKYAAGKGMPALSKIELNQCPSVSAFIIDKVQDGKNNHLVLIAERSGHFP